MVVITFLAMLGAGIWVAYWVGRGVRLNKENDAIAEAASRIKTEGLKPNDVVNVATGEVLSKRERKKALDAGVVRFEL